METIGTILDLALLIKSGAFVAGSALVGTLLTIAAYDLVLNKLWESGVFRSASVRKPAKGGAL
jgi:hypothetical protein